MNCSRVIETERTQWKFIVHQYLDSLSQNSHVSHMCSCKILSCLPITSWILSLSLAHSFFKFKWSISCLLIPALLLWKSELFLCMIFYSVSIMCLSSRGLWHIVSCSLIFKAGVFEIFICNWSGHAGMRRGIALNSTAEIRY